MEEERGDLRSEDGPAVIFVFPKDICDQRGAISVDTNSRIEQAASIRVVAQSKYTLVDDSLILSRNANLVIQTQTKESIKSALGL